MLKEFVVKCDSFLRSECVSRNKKVTFSSLLHTVWEIGLYIFTDSTFSENYSSQNKVSTLLFE